ncbi:MAG: diguanylate cyclase [Bryobacteraceae bacterium]
MADLDPDLYRTVLESLPAAVYVVDRDRRILLWNDGAEKLTGYLRHEVIGRHCDDNLLMHCDPSGAILCGAACPLLDSMHDGQPREADLFLLHRHGQRVPVRIRTVPLRDDQGHIRGVTECFDEIVAGPGTQCCAGPGVNDALDDVTKIPGHKATWAYIRTALESLGTDGSQSLGVLSIAADGLDRLRHGHGRIAVNAVLYATAQTLQRNLHSGEMVGRWSEDRFVALVTATSNDALLRSANALKRLASLEGVPWWGDRLSVTLSIGGTLVKAGDDAESAVHRAEEALQTSLREYGNFAVVV